MTQVFQVPGENVAPLNTFGRLDGTAVDGGLRGNAEETCLSEGIPHADFGALWRIPR